MKIIKRNGAEVPFDITKIITAVTKASDSVGGKARLSREQITDIAAAVTDQCQALNRAVSVEEAQDMVCEDAEVQIQGYDIDDEVLKMARANAALAGVEDKIHFQRRDIINFSSPKKYGFVVSNPPYGERLSDKKQMEMLYRSIGQIIKENDTWSFFLLSGYEEAQKMIGKKADKNRKIYNGMMKTYLYQYMGIKPPRRPAKDQ